jgi:hypothetical protein
MKRETTTLLALVGVSLGARHVFSYLARRRALRLAKKPEPIQSWETEGGAVPVAPNRTAAQTTPVA